MANCCFFVFRFFFCFVFCLFQFWFFEFLFSIIHFQDKETESDIIWPVVCLWCRFRRNVIDIFIEWFFLHFLVLKRCGIHQNFFSFVWNVWYTAPNGVAYEPPKRIQNEKWTKNRRLFHQVALVKQEFGWLSDNFKTGFPFNFIQI